VSDDALLRIDCETRCFYGTGSSCAPVGERLARVLPRATLTMLDGGHFLPTEKPRELSAALHEFFRG